ncbi:hypothetical protein ACQYWY_21805 [Comamonas sediminis]|uniref:hypothetical protein n=1 Tax=Comamonas sediminis TaxID=1783360 RepID=UPI003D2751FF
MTDKTEAQVDRADMVSIVRGEILAEVSSGNCPFAQHVLLVDAMYAIDHQAERLAAMEAVIQQLTSGPAVVAAYAVGELCVERALRRVGPKQMAAYWAVRRDGFALNKQGEWEYEPMPSSRTDEFLERCRFADVNEAIAAAVLKHEEEAQ